MGWLDALFGGPATGKTYSADPVTQFPTHEDAEFARKYDFSYGQPYAPYFTGDRANLLAGDPNADLIPTKAASGRKLASEGLGDYYARAALAANRSPLATLGFDPSKTAADIWNDPKRVNILGTYNPGTDQVYANALDPSSIVHESIHRGEKKLADSPLMQSQWGELTDKPVMNEAVVRMLMKNKMGDPENFPGDQKQKAWAESMFNLNPMYQRKLDAMEDAAARLLAKRRPMGPR